MTLSDIGGLCSAVSEQSARRRSALFKQKRMLIRAELRTVTTAPFVSAYRKPRRTR